MQSLEATVAEECIPVAVLTVQIQDNVDECLNMPSQAARKPGSGNQSEVNRQPSKKSKDVSFKVCRLLPVCTQRQYLNTLPCCKMSCMLKHIHILNSLHIIMLACHCFSVFLSGLRPFYFQFTYLVALQVADLRKKIEDEQRMLMQWSEERLALAQSLLGLLELHLSQANKDIAAFDSELQVCVLPLFSVQSEIYEVNLNTLICQICLPLPFSVAQPCVLCNFESSWAYLLCSTMASPARITSHHAFRMLAELCICTS